MATAPTGAESSSEQSEEGVKGLGCLTLKLWVLLCVIMDTRASTASISPTPKPPDRDAPRVPRARSFPSILINDKNGDAGERLHEFICTQHLQNVSGCPWRQPGDSLLFTAALSPNSLRTNTQTALLTQTHTPDLPACARTGTILP